MNIGLSLGINSRSMAFSPRRLADGASVWAWYDPSDLSTLWKDSGATSPVTDDNDVPVLMQDKSGNGLHVTLSNAVYRTDGTLRWIAFNGTTTSGVTGTITPGADKVQVFAGVRKASDAATGLIAETSASINSNNGTFALFGPLGAAANYRFASRGTTQAAADTASSFAAPISNILTGLGDIAADGAVLRVNGAVATSSPADQGTGNYLPYALYIGRRGGTTIPFSGQLFGLIVRFSAAALDTARLQDTEQWLATRSGVAL